MVFTTKVDIPAPGFTIEPDEEMLFVGSCFADAIGRRFQDDHFRATVNPFGVMYNPISIEHTVEKLLEGKSSSEQRGVAAPRTVVLTLGTNHVYRLRATEEIVDNCQKKPAHLFREEELSVDDCTNSLCRTVGILSAHRPDVRVIVTVSPIRYAKYGFHGSQLSKATLLLAANRLVEKLPRHCYYFPAYEIVLDELRDYRFYQPDMLHPTAQAADYVYERFRDTCFSTAAQQFVDEWRPLKLALGHHPFNPDSDDYRRFAELTREKIAAFEAKWRK